MFLEHGFQTIRGLRVYSGVSKSGMRMTLQNLCLRPIGMTPVRFQDYS